MPGSQGMDRQGLPTENYWGGTEFQGEAAEAGDIPIVLEELREGVTGGAPSNPAQSCKMGVVTGGQDGVPREGKTKALLIQRV